MANRRFEMHEYRQAIVRLRLGESSRAIARSGLVGRRKAEALRQVADEQGWLEPSSPLPDNAALVQVLRCPAPRPQMASSVLPYQEEVKSWWGQGIQGTTIHQALVRKYGYSGSYSSVRRFLQQLLLSHPDATTVMDFEPGDVAQVDFGRGPTIQDVYIDQSISTWVFVMVLAWSRHQYAEIVRDQKIETWLGCHRRAFEFFGGVPRRVVIDNPRTAISKACYHDPEVQRAYGEFAEGYGFLISPCPVRDPKKKGRVEAGVKYVKRNFLPLREFRSLTDANRQLQEWVLGAAGNRLHGTTQERPLTRFASSERHLLGSLPDIPPELVAWAKAKVHGDCHVQFEKCRYSVPYTLVGKPLWLRVSQTTVRVFQDQMLVAVHARGDQPGARSTVIDHLPPEDRAYRMRDPQWCLKQAQQIGPACAELIQTLFSDRVLDNLRAAQGIVGLNKTYGSARLDAACQRALSYDNPRYRTIKTILEKGLDQQAHTPDTHKSLAGAYGGQGRFCRNVPSLFN